MSLEEEAKAMWEKQITKPTLVGTPKTLEQAIQNAIDEVCLKESNERTSTLIEKHVRDFLAQKFQLFMNGSSDITDTVSTAIWNKIMGIK